jgi:hypothetical protein
MIWGRLYGGVCGKARGACRKLNDLLKYRCLTVWMPGPWESTSAILIISVQSGLCHASPCISTKGQLSNMCPFVQEKVFRGTGDMNSRPDML